MNIQYIYKTYTIQQITLQSKKTHPFTLLQVSQKALKLSIRDRPFSANCLTYSSRDTRHPGSWTEVLHK